MSNDRPIIIWQDPPAVVRHPPLRHKALVMEVKTRPGEWALVARRPGPSPAYALGDTLRKKHYQALVAPGTLSVTVRRINEDDYGVWAKYNAPRRRK